MAAYIPVPRDLTRVKSKVFFNLTKRQLICFGAAALIGVPFFFFSQIFWQCQFGSIGHDYRHASTILSRNVRKGWTAA